MQCEGVNMLFNKGSQMTSTLNPHLKSMLLDVKSLAAFTNCPGFCCLITVSKLPHSVTKISSGAQFAKLESKKGDVGGRGLKQHCHDW